MNKLLIAPDVLKLKLDKKEKLILLDVRTLKEHDTAKISNSVLIPLQELENRLNELDIAKEIIVYCHHGTRSLIAAKFLQSKGFNAKSLDHGIETWSNLIDPLVPHY